MLPRLSALLFCCTIILSACTTEEKAPPPPDGRPLLEAAYRNMGRIFSYHALATLETDVGRATIDGDFGVERVRYTMLRFDGVSMRVIIDGKKAYVSAGADSSWSIDTTGGAIDMAQMVTAPAGPKLGLRAGEKVSTIATEEVDGLATTHLRVERAAPIDIWVGVDSALGGVIRRIRMPAGSAGGVATITYSQFNKQYEIVPPVVRGD
jgi:hypothetical protein